MPLDTRVEDNIRLFEAAPDVSEDNVTYLLLHGLGASLDVWTEVAPALGLVRHTIAIDIPGFGKSSTPSAGFTLDHVAAAIGKICSSLDIDNCVLVAHSMGAFVAFRLVALETVRFRRLIVVDGTLGRAIKLIKSPQRVFKDPELSLYVFSQVIGGTVPIRPWTAKAISSSPIVRQLTLWPYIASPRETDPELLANALSDNGSLAVAKALSEARRLDHIELMRAVSRPVDLAWGAEDHLISHEDVEQARRFMAIDRELEIQSCGHWPMIERPEVLTAFILSCEQADAIR